MKKLFVLAWIVVAIGMSVAAYGQNTALRVGAAKVDVTPAANALPQNYQGILDHIYSRAIVIDNGSATAALITVDAGGVSDAIWQAVSKQLESELGIPAKNVLLTATHSHSVPGQPAGPYTQKIVESVRLAKQRLAPARIGYGTGVSYINVNRNIIDPKTKRWWEGPNYEGPSDKTVAVIKFESLSGEPLAVYYNYAMHGVAAGQLDLVSGDAPGQRRSTSKTRSTTRSSHCGRAALLAIRILSIFSRPTTCARSGSKTTPSAVRTSATRCLPAARGWTGRIPR